MNDRPPPHRLFLFRHAKSAWDDPALRDFERPLAPRGIRACAAMGALMAEKGWYPDKALVSAAARTRETWTRLWQAMQAGERAQPETSYHRDLYLAEPERIFNIIRTEGGTARAVLLIGHNPGLQMAAERLAGFGGAALRNTLSEKFPTGALAVLDFNIEEWADLYPGTGDLVAFVRPRDIAD